MEFLTLLDKSYKQLFVFLQSVRDYQRQKETRYPMHIAGVDFCDKTGEPIIVVDIIGVVKHILPRYRPEDLLDDEIIENFPPTHVKMITFLACKKFFEDSTILQLCTTEIIDNKTILTFKNISTEILYRKTAEEIIYDQNLFLKFSKNDIKKIVFSAAQDQYRLEEAV